MACCVQVLEDSLSEADGTLAGLSEHHMQWKSAVRQARAAVNTLLADSLLTAAYLVYCGPLEPSRRDGLLSDWMSRFDTISYSMH